MSWELLRGLRGNHQPEGGGVVLTGGGSGHIQMMALP